MRPNLTIAIPTVTERALAFAALKDFLQQQVAQHRLEEKVEIISLCDSKEISIGEKRQRLYAMARGSFCVQIDDDDTVHPAFAAIINAAIERDPDLDGIGYVEHCTVNGQVFLAHHSDRWPDWGENRLAEGRLFHFVRTLFFKDPIRTEICRRVGVRDMRWGEDRDFSRRLKASGLLGRTIDLNEMMYFYRYEETPAAARYGFAHPAQEPGT